MQFKEYPSYKNSGVEWLGDVPDHWSVIPSKFYFIERKEKAENKDKQLTASQKYGIVFQEDFMAENGRVMVVMKNPEILKKVRPNDFVISMRSFQGGLELSYLEGSISSAYVMLKPNLHVVDIEYFKYLFKTPRYIQSLQSTSNLIRDGQALRFNNFSQVKLVLPPKSDQHKIVSFLNTETARIDNLIAKQEKLIELLEEQRKSIISHAVTKGLNPNAPMKDSGVEWLGDVPKHWTLKPIKFLAKINQFTLNEITDGDFEIQYVDIGSVSTTNGIEKIETILFKDAPSRARRIVKDGDIIVSTVRTYLKAIAYIENPPKNLIVSTGFAVLNPIKIIILPKYAKFTFLAEQFIAEVIAKSKGISYPAITATELADIKIALPPLNEQKVILNYLWEENLKIDNLIFKQNQLIEKLKKYRSSIISHAVTGKIDVRGFVA